MADVKTRRWAWGGYFIALGMYWAVTGVRAYVLWRHADVHHASVPTGLLTNLALPFAGEVGVLTLWLAVATTLAAVGIRELRSTATAPMPGETS